MMSGYGKLFYRTLIIGLLLLIGQLLAARKSPFIEVQASVDRNTITIGDRITYSLKIIRDEALTIQQPGPGANLGQFEIKDYQIHPPRRQDGRIVEQYDYVISVFDTGRFVIPPFPVAFQLADSTAEPRIIRSEAIPIEVRSVLSSADARLKDIKPPLSIPRNYWRWVLWAGLGALLVAASILGWYWHRRRKAGRPLFRKQIIRPAHEIALEALEELRQSPLLTEQDYKGFFSRLSEILREYLENRFFIAAREETTSEILTSMRALHLEDEQLLRLQEVLSLCDLVKFARYQPEPTEIEGACAMSETFIRATRLEFPAVEVAEAENAPRSASGQEEQSDSNRPAQRDNPGNRPGKREQQSDDHNKT